MSNREKCGLTFGLIHLKTHPSETLVLWLLLVRREASKSRATGQLLGHPWVKRPKSFLEMSEEWFPGASWWKTCSLGSSFSGVQTDPPRWLPSIPTAHLHPLPPCHRLWIPEYLLLFCLSRLLFLLHWSKNLIPKEEWVLTSPSTQPSHSHKKEREQ